MTGQELKQIRKAWRLTQPQMAKLLNTPFKTYVSWEWDKHRIPGAVVVALECLKEKEGVLK